MTVRAFWEGAAVPLGLDAGFVDEAVARAGDNVQHAVQLRKRLAVLPPEQRRVEGIPRGLAALIEKSWERIAVDAVVVDGLGILCAAREAFTLDELGAVAGWAGDAERRAFVRAAKELLVETSRPGGQAEYRLHHDSIDRTLKVWDLVSMRVLATLGGHDGGVHACTVLAQHPTRCRTS